MNLVPAAGFPLSTVGLATAGGSFGVQSFGIDAVFEMHRKNADAVVRATCVVLDGLNRMAKRQGDLLAAAVNDHVRVALDGFTLASFEEKASQQVCVLGDVYVSSVASLREQSGIAAQANVAAGDILSTRVGEAFDEIGRLFGKPAASTTASDVTDATVAEPAVDVDATVVEPAAQVGEAAAADNAALVEAVPIVVEAVPIVGPATKTRPRKASPPGRRPTSRN